MIDGGYSNNVPIINRETVTVSPFSGGADICPPDDQVFIFKKKLVFKENIIEKKKQLSKICQSINL